MPFTRKSKNKSTKNYEHACEKGYCPTSKEIKNSKIQELAHRLKRASYKETLTNVLEWQDSNIDFWFERYKLSIILKISLVIFSLFVYITILFEFLLSRSNIAILLTTIIWGIILATALAITILMLYDYRQIPLKETHKQLYNILRSSLPINALLENKLGICRDYAKLTACLLSNIYPDKEIYFASTTTHVATGIEIETGKLFILDQHLPILTIAKWHILHPSAKKIQILKGNSLKFEPIKLHLSESGTTPINFKKLKKNITELLEIKEREGDEGVQRLELVREKGVTRYEDNEIVTYSLARWLEMKISFEMLELNQVTDLEIKPEEEDLRFIISFKSDE